MKRFNRYLLQFLKDAKLWLFFMFYLSIFRIAFIVYFRRKLDPDTHLTDVFLPALNGMRFDSMVSTCWIAIPVIASVLFVIFNADRVADRIRAVTGSVFTVVTTIAWVVTFGFFQEYNDQFNYMLFNLYYDDTKAIFKTIWADYHPILYLLIMAGVTGGALLLQKKLLRRNFFPPDKIASQKFTPLSGIITVVLIMALLVTGARGSVGPRPAQRKDVSVSKDAFLNQAVLNPYFSLLFTVEDQRDASGWAGLENFLPDGDVRKAAEEIFHNKKSYDNLDEYLLKRARGPKGVPPRHVFLIVMESYDEWPLLKKYASLGITPNLSEFARKGIYFDRFLPASGSTMQSFAAIMTSIPYTHVELNYQIESRKPYPSSLPEAFRRLGYRTRLFYGGFLSWQRFGDFARDQGFEEVYGAPHMWKPGATTHEWGIDDEYLVDFVLGKMEDDRPTFNVILNTSYHPPYNVDVWSKGFPLHDVPDDLKPLFDGTTTIKMLGHLWYADKCIGDLVRQIEAKLPRTLFVFTGDHFGRKFINARPEFFERSGVPLILYGRDVLRGVRMQKDTVGGHIDIAPTLLELAAPKGFTYYSMGQDLLAPRRENLGIGWFRVIGKDFILDLSSGPAQFYPLPGIALPDKMSDLDALKTYFNRTYGIGWWRVRRGAQLEGAPQPTYGKR